MKRTITWIMFFTLSCLHFRTTPSLEITNTSQDSLNTFLHDYAFKSLPKRRTGRLYNVALPANFSGMETSVVRLRAHSLWRNGINLSSFEIPPRFLPSPFTRRLDVVYRDLGNWSRFYYNVPGHTLVAPVIGFLAYDSNRGSPVDLYTRVNRDPIIVRFPNVSVLQGNGDDLRSRMKCVRFGTNGTLEMSNVTGEGTRACLAGGVGHFSIVIPYQPGRDKGRVIKGWVVGVLSGFVGLGVIVVIGIVVYKLLKWIKMREMQRESERSEGLGTVWIGEYRVPTASGIRTQPVLENSYVP